MIAPIATLPAPAHGQGPTAPPPEREPVFADLLRSFATEGDVDPAPARSERAGEEDDSRSREISGDSQPVPQGDESLADESPDPGAEGEQVLATATPPVPPAPQPPVAATVGGGEPAAAVTDGERAIQAMLVPAVVVGETKLGSENATAEADPGVAAPPSESETPPPPPPTAAGVLAQTLKNSGSGTTLALAAQEIGDSARAGAPERGPTMDESARQPARPTPQGARSMPAEGPEAVAKQPPTKPEAPAPLILAQANTAAEPGTAAKPVAGESASVSAIAQAPRELPGASPQVAGAGRPFHTHVPLTEQLVLYIQRAARDGLDRIDIKLVPAELGRIEVRLDFSHDGRLTAAIAAERPETLELLQRDARGLERALQDAGLKTDGGGLTFNLKGEQQQDAREERGPAARLAIAAAAAEASIATAPGGLRADALLDIRV